MGESVTQEEMRLRTKAFGVRIVKLVAALPKSRIGDVLGRQILKSGTSIGANYREATRASSTKHFISILEIALREADETKYWLELIEESKLFEASKLSDLNQECSELIAILAATVKTTKQNSK